MIEIEWVFEDLRKTPYEPLHEEEKGIVGDVVVNKKVNALSESLVYFYKQGTMTNMELVFLVSTILKYVKCVVHCKSYNYIFSTNWWPLAQMY
jgi:hypothetical protein